MEEGKADGREEEARKRRARVRRLLVQHTKRRFAEMRAESEVPLLAPFSPTPDALIPAVLEAVSLSGDDVLVDLGCGDGRWCVQAALRAAGCRCVGVDINEAALAKAAAAAEAAGVAGRCEFRRASILDTDLSSASIVVAYWFRDSIAEFGEWLASALAEGTTLVSVNFRVPGASPRREVTVGKATAYVLDAAEVKRALAGR